MVIILPETEVIVVNRSVTRTTLNQVHASKNFEATLSKQLATLLPVASTLLLLWMELNNHIYSPWNKQRHKRYDSR